MCERRRRFIYLFVSDERSIFPIKQKVGLYSAHHTHLFTMISQGGSPLCLLVYFARGDLKITHRLKQSTIYRQTVLWMCSQEPALLYWSVNSLSFIQTVSSYCVWSLLRLLGKGEKKIFNVLLIEACTFAIDRTWIATEGKRVVFHFSCSSIQYDLFLMQKYLCA